MRDAYGMTVGQFVAGWEAFVREQYTIDERKGPTVRPPRPGLGYPDPLPPQGTGGRRD